MNKITLVLAGTVTAFLTNVNAAAIARKNAARTLELWEQQTRLGTLNRYRSALLFGSLGDTVQDKDGKVAHAHHEEWHRAVAEKMAKNVGRQWQTKAKLQSARKETGRNCISIGVSGSDFNLISQLGVKTIKFLQQRQFLKSVGLKFFGCA